MKQWDDIIKTAKHCHTKEAWENLFSRHQDTIITCNQARLIEELTRLLLADPLSSQYNPAIFVALLKGCLSAWNLESGEILTKITRKISSPDLSIESARLLLEKGNPQLTRDICKKALRNKNTSELQSLTLQLLICNSYSEEGLHQKATKALSRLTKDISETSSLPLKEEANFRAQMARIHFFLGQYEQASELFRQASFRFIKLEDWEAAAKALFNTAACAQNAGKKPVDHAYSFVEESRLISEKHGLKGPLSHCEAFYGLDSYNHGNFSEARDHFRKALDYLPGSDQSYRRLHIISMLTLSYLALGNYSLANKFGRQTILLAKEDHSNRYQSRYRSLEAELMWESGKPLESQSMLEETVRTFVNKGVHTLEELSTYNRYSLQTAWLGGEDKILVPDIDQSLKHHKFTWMDHCYALGQLCLNRDDFQSAQMHFNTVFKMALENDDRYHHALALLGFIQLHLGRHDTGPGFLHSLRDFKLTIRKMTDTPMKTWLNMVMAAHAWQEGDLKECIRALKASKRYSRVGFSDKFVINYWLETLEGRAVRMQAEWQHAVVSRYTRLCFAPDFKVTHQRRYQIGPNYQLDLTRHQLLGDIIDFLLIQPDFASSPQGLQQHVWKQSVNTQGWRQKIRNTLMRFRDITPFSVAPLIIQNKQKIRLNSDAIRITPPRRFGSEREDEVCYLLNFKSMTSGQISERLAISKATTKRVLNSMIRKNKIHLLREGRQIYYHIKKGETGGHRTTASQTRAAT